MKLLCQKPKNDEYCNNCKHSKPHEFDNFACRPKCHIGNCNCMIIDSDVKVLPQQEKFEILI